MSDELDNEPINNPDVEDEDEEEVDDETVDDDDEDPGEDMLIDYVLNVCGLNHNQKEALQQEGLISIQNYIDMDSDDIDEMTSRLSKLSRGGCRFGQVVIKNLKALIYWVQDHTRRNKWPDLNNFDERKLKP